MEPQFILNVGGLEKLGFTEKEFLELLEMDVSKAVSATDCPTGLGCPKCKRTMENTFFIFHSYQCFDFDDSKEKHINYKYTSKNFHLCICGCLYFLMSYSEQIVAPELKEKKES